LYTHIMVPVDLAHEGRLDRALKTAADLAQHYGARVTYASVTGSQPSSVAHTPQEFAEKLARFSVAQGETAGLSEVGSHPIVSHDPSVDLDRALADAADELGADLIVMGSHIPRAFDLRSHGAHLAQLSHHSVMLVRDAS